MPFSEAQTWVSVMSCTPRRRRARAQALGQRFHGAGGGRARARADHDAHRHPHGRLRGDQLQAPRGHAAVSAKRPWLNHPCRFYRSGFELGERIPDS